MTDCTCIKIADGIIRDAWCPTHRGADDKPWLRERSWDVSGANVPGWVVPAAVIGLIVLVWLVALAVAVM